MKNQQPTVMIVNAYGRSNRGDSVLLDECIADILAVLPSAKIIGALFEGRAEAQTVHADIVWTERIGNTSIHGPLAKFVTLFRLAVAALATVPLCGRIVKLLPITQRQTWFGIRRAEYVVSAPGGYIHDTNFAYYVALLHIWLGNRAKALVVLAPQSVGPIDSLFARSVARRVLAPVPAICARESYSYAFLTQELGLAPTQVVRAGDSAFWNRNVIKDTLLIESARAEIGLSRLKEQRILGITVVNWNFPKSDRPQVDSEAYVSAMGCILDHMANNHGLQPVIFNQVSDDLEMAKRVASAAKTHVLIDRVSREPEVLRALIAESTLFLGTRFHSCIFAMMAGRPTFAIAYLPKTSFILDDLKLSHRQIPIDNILIKTVITQLESDLASLSISESEINHAVDAYRHNHARLRDVLKVYL